MYDDTQIRLGIACIAAAFGKAMQKTDPEFGANFVNQLDTLYRELKDTGDDNTAALEMIKWTGDAMERLKP